MQESVKKTSHFQGKSALNHLIDARKKGFDFTQEAHASELSGYVYASCKSAYETTGLYLILLPILSFQPIFFFSYFLAIFFPFCLWKTASYTMKGFAKLERLHKLIEEEHWEITHNREQEKQELYALYRAKGFSGKILDEIIVTLMSDDHRLLEVMLTEELGLKLSQYEHPLQAGIAAFCTSSIICFVLGITVWCAGFFPSFFASLLFLSLSAFFEAKKENIRRTEHVIWHFSLAILLYTCSTLLLQLLF